MFQLIWAKLEMFIGQNLISMLIQILPKSHLNNEPMQIGLTMYIISMHEVLIIPSFRFAPNQLDLKLLEAATTDVSPVYA